MSEPAPTPSLIQQRMAIERGRGSAIAMMIGFSLIAAYWLYRALFEGGDGMFWVFAVGGLIVVVMSGFSLASIRRKLRAFEAEHGPDAGKQN